MTWKVAIEESSHIVPQSVRIELYGIPRTRAGQPRDEYVVDDQMVVSLRDVLRFLVTRYPNLSPSCVTRNGELTADCIVNLNGRRFVRSPETEIQRGDAVLILSADAGG